MKILAAEYPVEEICDVLEVSKSGYYKWLRRTPSKRACANSALLGFIQTIHMESRCTYGSPRITEQLQRNGIHCGKNRVAKLMRNQGIQGRRKRAFRPRTTNSRHDHPIAPNVLKDTIVNAPDKVWVADITYVRTMAGWVYLAAVMDLYSRKIVGWSIGNSLEANLVKEALKQALVDRRPAPGLLHHSDRGIQYASSAFRALLHSWNLTASMSGKGNCYDNAVMEAFWSTLKTELIYESHFRNLEEARTAIFDYIVTFYNRKRLHSTLGYKSPVEFENEITYKNN